MTQAAGPGPGTSHGDTADRPPESAQTRSISGQSPPISVQDPSAFQGLTERRRAFVDSDPLGRPRQPRTERPTPRPRAGPQMGPGPLTLSQVAAGAVA